MPAKRKTLPKNFEALLEKGSVARLKAVFDACEVDARGGFEKQTALAFEGCPDELTRWLVANGEARRRVGSCEPETRPAVQATLSAVTAV